MVEWLQFTLRAWEQSGEQELAAQLLDRVNISPGDPAAVVDKPGVPCVRMFSVSRKDFAHVDTTLDAGARSEAFAAATRAGLIRAAEWLTRQPVELFEQLRTAYLQDLRQAGRTVVSQTRAHCDAELDALEAAIARARSVRRSPAELDELRLRIAALEALLQEVAA